MGNCMPSRRRLGRNSTVGEVKHRRRSKATHEILDKISTHPSPMDAGTDVTPLPCLLISSPCSPSSFFPVTPPVFPPSCTLEENEISISTPTAASLSSSLSSPFRNLCSTASNSPVLSSTGSLSPTSSNLLSFSNSPSSHILYSCSLSSTNSSSMLPTSSSWLPTSSTSPSSTDSVSTDSLPTDSSSTESVPTDPSTDFISTDSVLTESVPANFVSTDSVLTESLPTDCSSTDSPSQDYASTCGQLTGSAATDSPSTYLPLIETPLMHSASTDSPLMGPLSTHRASTDSASVDSPSSSDSLSASHSSPTIFPLKRRDTSPTASTASTCAYTPPSSPSQPCTHFDSFSSPPASPSWLLTSANEEYSSSSFEKLYHHTTTDPKSSTACTKYSCSSTTSSSVPQGSPIVIDFGSSVTRAGFATNVGPASIFPTAVARARCMFSSVSCSSIGRCMFSSVSCSSIGMGNQRARELSYPIRDGIISNWEDMENLLQFTLGPELGLPNLDDHPVLLSQPSFATPEQLRRLAEYLFENLSVTALCFVPQTSLALYGCGLKTGVVVDLGEGFTSVEAAYEGHVIHQPSASPSTSYSPYAKELPNMHLSGSSLTDYFIRLLMRSRGSIALSKSRIDLNTRIGRTIADDMKKTFSQVHATPLSYSPSDTSAVSKIKHYILPDGEVLEFESDIGTRCSEGMFNPQELGGRNCASLQSVVVDCVERCDVDLRKELYGNIVMCGGVSTIKGLPERLEAEVRNECRRRRSADRQITNEGPEVSSSRSVNSVRVVKVDDRQNLVWKGGAVLASWGGFTSMCTTRQEYEEAETSAIVRWKRF